MNLQPMVLDYLRERGYGHVTGYMDEADVTAFRSIVERMPQHFRMVELGSAFGSSAITFALLAKDMGKTCDILCIDMFLIPGSEERFVENTKDFDNITYRAESFNVIRFVYDGGPIDLYFDDASHYEIPTYAQLVYWSQYAKNIAVHDYTEDWKGHVRSVDKFAVERGLNLEQFVESSVVYMENVR
jgi:hypothetical protein